MTGRVSNGSESIKSKHMPWTPQEKHFWNGKIRTSKNPLLHEASLVVQRLRLWASTAAGTDLIPGWGTKILHVQHGQKKKKETLLHKGMRTLAKIMKINTFRTLDLKQMLAIILWLHIHLCKKKNWISIRLQASWLLSRLIPIPSSPVLRPL